MGELTLGILGAAAAYWLQRGKLRNGGKKLHRAWLLTTGLGLTFTVLAASRTGERVVLAAARVLTEVSGG